MVWKILLYILSKLFSLDGLRGSNDDEMAKIQYFSSSKFYILLNIPQFPQRVKKRGENFPKENVYDGKMEKNFKKNILLPISYHALLFVVIL